MIHFLNKTVLVGLIILIQLHVFSQEKVEIDKVIAIVGNETILLSDIENQYLQYQARGQFSKGDQRCEILEEMLFQNLLITQAKIDSIDVTEMQVKEEIDRRIEMFIQQIGSPEKLEEHFQKTIPEIKVEFQEIVYKQLVAQSMQQEIVRGVSISPLEVKSYYLRLPKDSLPIVDAEIEMAQIQIKPKMTEAEEKAVVEKLESYRKRVESGDDFATLAVLYSDDPGSAKRGGELGFVGRAELVPEFSAAAFNLEANQMSEIVKTEYGYHLIQMLERRGERINVRHILITPKASYESEKEAKSKLDSIASLIRTEKLTFERAALLFSDDETSKRNGGLLVNPYTGTSKFESKQIDPSTFYVIRKLKENEISDAIKSKDQQGNVVYKLVKLKSKTEAHTATLDTDYQKIQDMTLAQKNQNTISEWTEKRVKETYIKISDVYLTCKFSFQGWVK